MHSAWRVPGIAFRVQGDGRYEYVYLRPTNGRADDQARRNHSTQYSSFPDFDFARSRREAPEKYESYVDLQPGAWTSYKIEVDECVQIWRTFEYDQRRELKCTGRGLNRTGDETGEGGEQKEASVRDLNKS